MMKELHYSTVVTEQHAIRVATWSDNGSLQFKICLDGEVLDEGTLDDPKEGGS